MDRRCYETTGCKKKRKRGRVTKSKSSPIKRGVESERSENVTEGTLGTSGTPGCNVLRRTWATRRERERERGRTRESREKERERERRAHKGEWNRPLVEADPGVKEEIRAINPSMHAAREERPAYEIQLSTHVEKVKRRPFVSRILKSRACCGRFIKSLILSTCFLLLPTKYTY